MRQLDPSVTLVDRIGTVDVRWRPIASGRGHPLSGDGHSNEEGHRDR